MSTRSKNKPPVATDPRVWVVASKDQLEEIGYFIRFDTLEDARNSIEEALDTTNSDTVYLLKVEKVAVRTGFRLDDYEGE